MVCVVCVVCLVCVCGVFGVCVCGWGGGLSSDSSRNRATALASSASCDLYAK